MISPICTAVGSEPFPIGDEPQKCGVTGYMGCVINSLSSLRNGSTITSAFPTAGATFLSERTNRNCHHEPSIASGASAVWDSLALDDASSRHEHWLRSR